MYYWLLRELDRIFMKRTTGTIEYRVSRCAIMLKVRGPRLSAEDVG